MFSFYVYGTCDRSRTLVPERSAHVTEVLRFEQLPIGLGLFH